MNRRLVLLNAVLALVVVYGGVQLRREYQAAKAREAALRAVRILPAPPPPFVPLPNDAPVLPSTYKDVAMRYLFHPSRDPNVPVELPPPPPPPPPMPELPRFHGQMNLGDGPIALLVEKPGAPEKAVQPGETIGQFKLVDVNTSEIVFAWTFNGQLARRSLRELSDNTAASASASASPDARLANTVSAPAPPAVKSNLGAGETTAFGFRECIPNDSSPEGTVDRGFRKTIITTPFGKSCRWDPVK